MTASEVTEDKDLVYGTTECSCLDRALVILPRSVAQGIADRLGALGCETWGEVRRECSEEIYKELLDLAGYDTFEEFAEHLGRDRARDVTLRGIKPPGRPERKPAARPLRRFPQNPVEGVVHLAPLVHQVQFRLPDQIR